MDWKSFRAVGVSNKLKVVAVTGFLRAEILPVKQPRKINDIASKSIIFNITIIVMLMSS